MKFVGIASAENLRSAYGQVGQAISTLEYVANILYVDSGPVAPDTEKYKQLCEVENRITDLVQDLDSVHHEIGLVLGNF